MWCTARGMGSQAPATLCARPLAVRTPVALVRIEGRATVQLQAAVWNRIMRLPSAFFRGYSVGDLALRIFGVARISDLASGVAISALLGGVFAAVNLVLMLYFDWRLGLAARHDHGSIHPLSTLRRRQGGIPAAR